MKKVHPVGLHPVDGLAWPQAGTSLAVPWPAGLGRGRPAHRTRRLLLEMKTQV